MLSSVKLGIVNTHERFFEVTVIITRHFCPTYIEANFIRTVVVRFEKILYKGIPLSSKMPYRRYGKYARRPSYRSRRFSRASAASSIARAWRARKRRKTGLVSRTALSNRRQIRTLKKNVETKVMRDNQATQALQFAGQFNDSILVDNDGQEVPAALPFAGDLLYCEQGTGQNQRVGAWIQLKSMTMHYNIYTNAPTQDATYQVLIVLDREPLLGASLTGAAGVLELDSAAPAPPNALDLAFQNLGQTGKVGRFKILARKTHRLSSPLVVTTQVPAIQTAAAGGAGTTYGNVTRATYLEGVCTNMNKSYPAYVKGSINLKLSHKINYGPDVSVQPSNQTIRIFAFQCAPAGFQQPRCILQYYTRIRFKDA